MLKKIINEDTNNNGTVQSRQSPNQLAALKNKIVCIPAHHIEYHNKLVKLYMEQSEWKAALKEINFLLKIEPRNTPLHILRGKIYINMGRYYKALVSFQEVLSENAREVYRYMGDAHFFLNHPHKAMEFYQKSLSNIPAEPHSLFGMAQVYIKLKKFKAAERLLLKSLSSKPDFKKSAYHLALLYQEMENFTQAIRYFKYFLLMQPGHIEARHYLASLYIFTGKESHAFEQWNRILTQQPQNILAHESLGSYYLKKNNFQAAIEEFEWILKIDPHQVVARLHLGSSYYMKEEYKKAIYHWKKLLREDKNRVEVYPLLASADIQLGNFRKAGEYLKTYLLSSKKVPDEERKKCFATLANLYVGIEDYKSAIDILKTGLNRYPQDIKLRMILCKLFNDIGVAALALREANRLMKIIPPTPELHFELGRAYKKTGNTSEAIKHYRKSISLKPGLNIYLELAQVYCELGNWPAACNIFFKSLRMNTQHPFSLAGLGICLMQMKKFKRSESVWKRFLHFYPDHALAYTALAEIGMVNARYDDAKSFLDDAFNIEKSNSQALFLLGIYFFKKNRPDKTLKTWQNLLCVDPYAFKIRTALIHDLLSPGEIKALFSLMKNKKYPKLIKEMLNLSKNYDMFEDDDDTKFHIDLFDKVLTT